MVNQSVGWTGRRRRQGKARQCRSDRSGAGDSGGFLFFCFSLAGRGFRKGERLGCEKEEQRERELIKRWQGAGNALPRQWSREMLGAAA